MKKSKIVTVLAAAALLTLSVTATSFAAKGDKEVDVNIGLATEAYSGLGTGFALSAGGGYELLDIKGINGSTLQIRGDIGYNSWSNTIYGVDVTGYRVPVSAGARLYVPIQAVKKLRVYGEGDLEVSFDKAEAAVPGFGLFSGAKVSASTTNVGLGLAGGAEYAFAQNIFAAGSLKYHVIDSGYLNFLVGIGFKF